MYYAVRKNTLFFFFFRREELKVNYLKQHLFLGLLVRGKQKRGLANTTLIHCHLLLLEPGEHIYHTFSFWHPLPVLLKFTRNARACENNRWIILFTVKEVSYLNFITQICQETLAML